MSDHNKTFDEILSELAQAKKDAERYRWLRNSNEHTHYGCSRNPGRTPMEKLMLAIEDDPRIFECIICEIPLAHVPKDGEPIWKDGGHFDFAANMDAAIDAAMQAQGKEEE